MVKTSGNRPRNGGVTAALPAGRYTIGVIPNQAPDPTALLQAWGRGDRAALDRLLPLVHGELRRLAARHMRHERAGHTLQASALVNEVYLRLVEVRQVQWQNRAHFFAMASRIMRRVLVDFPALDDALNALETVDPRKCRVVEMRFFGGMSIEETAEAHDGTRPHDAHTRIGQRIGAVCVAGAGLGRLRDFS
jgi:ECF sigma factor